MSAIKEISDKEAKESLYQMAAKMRHETRWSSMLIGDMEIGHLRNVINRLTLDFHTAYRAAPYEIVLAAKIQAANQPERYDQQRRESAVARDKYEHQCAVEDGTFTGPYEAWTDSI